jgi:uncharacterized protein (DUF58 family)
MNGIKNIFKHLYIHNLFFYIGIGIVVLSVFGFFIPVLFTLAKILLALLGMVFLLDVILLFNANVGVKADRILPEKMSNGDENQIDIRISNLYTFKVNCSIIDEIPSEFQVRDFHISKTMDAQQESEVRFTLRPTFRGNITFGSLIVYVTSPLCMVKRRFDFNNNATIPVYPSFIQLRKHELIAFSNRLTQHGLKKVRRIGHTMEFEKIKEYVPGDDFRTVNWKATAKSQKLMVNQYQDERSQAVYSIVDNGRVMKMPFNGLSLLDYAINASLVVSNVVLKKQDNVGFMSFSRKVENKVPAERKATHSQRIMEALYHVKTDFYESDFGRLYAEIKQGIPQRSLLLLYTNFETMDGLTRQLPYLKAISRSHLLIVVFFQNTEMDLLIQKPSESLQAIYDKVIAEKFNFEKKLIVNELKKYGIQSVLTKPENLTIDTINKYLEIKARGML